MYRVYIQQIDVVKKGQKAGTICMIYLVILIDNVQLRNIYMDSKKKIPGNRHPTPYLTRV